MNSTSIVGTALALASLAAHAQLSGPTRLDDTGMTQCVGADGQFTAQCAATGQDGASGRDVRMPSDADGHAGFKYIKLDDGGHRLPADAANWRCVADRVTGLVWEMKTVGGISGTKYRYTNYGDGSELDTSSLIAQANDKSICGVGNWRLPTINELQSLIDYGAAGGPQIDTAWFPNTADNWYWTSTGYAGDPKSAWAVYFDGAAGGDGAGQRMFALSARLVHDTKLAPPPGDPATRYAFAADEVTDTWTHLVWKRCSLGQVFDGATCTGFPTKTEWVDALAAAGAQATLTGAAWRLPNVKELSTIMDRTMTYPALDETVFPNSPVSGDYWTSTPSAADPTLVWTVDTRGGYTQTYPAASYPLASRLVRDLSASR